MQEKISLGMPLSLRILDGIVAFFLRYVLKYRLEVIRKNLRDSFHYGSFQETEQDVKAFYLYLAKIIRQILASPSRHLLERRLDLVPSPELDHWLEEGKSVIVTFGHVGNWEWTGSYLGMEYPDQVCALYKKIKSPWLNRLMYKRRQSHVNYLIEIKQMGELLRLIKNKPVLVLMISDQNPGSDQGIIWTSFLRRNTAFVNGPENLALRYKLPVVYIHSSPKTDGGYTLTCETLYNGTEDVIPGEITGRYASCLENNINAYRSNWLWSHKRWKRTK
jgi:KDO2-lipid IV(A) lauroyltransferase